MEEIYETNLENENFDEPTITQTYNEANNQELMLRDSGSIEALQKLQEVENEELEQSQYINTNMAMQPSATPTDSMGQTFTKLKFANIQPERLPKAPVSRGFPKGKIRKAGNHSAISSSSIRQRMLKTMNVAPWGTGTEAIVYQRTPIVQPQPSPTRISQQSRYAKHHQADASTQSPGFIFHVPQTHHDHAHPMY